MADIIDLEEAKLQPYREALRMVRGDPHERPDLMTLRNACYALIPDLPVGPIYLGTPEHHLLLEHLRTLADNQLVEIFVRADAELNALPGWRADSTPFLDCPGAGLTLLLGAVIDPCLPELDIDQLTLEQLRGEIERQIRANDRWDEDIDLDHLNLDELRVFYTRPYP